MLVAGAVLFLYRLSPRLAPAARALLWWLVALQLMVGVGLCSPLALPLLPGPVAQSVAAAPPAIKTIPAMAAEPVAPSLGSIAAGPVCNVADTSAAAHAAWTRWDWPVVAWLAGLGLMIIRTLGGYGATRRRLGESQPCGYRNLLHTLQLAGEAHGLRRTPRLRLSAAIDSR